jgi:hypothetical protein
MNKDCWLLKELKFISLLCIMGMSLSACSKTINWKEEVLLHDSKVLLIERFYNLGGYPTLDASERALLDETITFTLPESKQKIVWQTEFRQDLSEPNSLGSLLLDIVDGVPYLVTSPAGCIAYNKWGRPNPPYVLFKYVNATWQQIPLQELPTELVQANLMNMPASGQLKPYYNVEAIKAKLANGNISAYAKTILREPIKDGGDSGCPEMIRTGDGGWDGIGWFSEQPSKEACLKYCEKKKVAAQNCPCNKLLKGK